MIKIGVGRLVVVISLLVAVLIIGAVFGAKYGDHKAAADLPSGDDSSQSSVDVLSDEPGPHAEAEAMDLAKSINAAASSCGVQAAAVEMNVHHHDSINAYVAAGRAVNACSSASAQTREIKIPAGLGKRGETDFRSAINICSEAHDQRAFAFREMQAAIDDHNISSIVDFQEGARQAGSQSDRCSQLIEDAAVTSGVPRDTITRFLQNNGVEVALRHAELPR